MAEPAVAIHDLTKSFGKFTAVDKISLTVGKGEIFGFLGANGAGKTTAIRMLCGLLMPTSGTGTVAGFDVIRQSREDQTFDRLYVAKIFPLSGFNRKGKFGFLRRRLQPARLQIERSH